MVSATRHGERYCTAVSNGRVQLYADTSKNGVGGAAGMRPHELLESALAACVCMSIDMAAEKAGFTLPAIVVEVVVDRRDSETCFNVTVRDIAALVDEQRELVRAAVLGSPVARTLGKPVRVALETGSEAGALCRP
ncbi:peroxiredoxin [Paraburkholderia monticola]|uniref:Peroxiredoxin n=1 Tax=Paraburkholderia monticola TaxID=1399968 RepID=A0A149PFG1_9BURK|nr:OsmC family protein [Paraburkholderia monticola]KXU83780.1 peroxiredoxin [Paraburkholderia monticola]